MVLHIKNTYEVDVSNVLCSRYWRRAYVTPKSYLSFVNGYKEVYTEKLESINEQAEHMQIGKQNRDKHTFPCMFSNHLHFYTRLLIQRSLKITGSQFKTPALQLSTIQSDSLTKMPQKSCQLNHLSQRYIKF